jgi:hypothetical protein
VLDLVLTADFLFAAFGILAGGALVGLVVRAAAAEATLADRRAPRDVPAVREVPAASPAGAGAERLARVREIGPAARRAPRTARLAGAEERAR